jgi:hypothetical protein
MRLLSKSRTDLSLLGIISKTKKIMRPKLALIYLRVPKRIKEVQMHWCLTFASFERI